MPPETALPLRVFVSASHDTALGPLLQGLRQAGVDAFVTSDVADLGGDLIQSARSAIDAADLVLVVLTKQPASNPFFEAGMAAALGKRLILITEPGATLSPDLREFVIVQSSIDDPAPVIAAVQEVARRPLQPSFSRAKATEHALGDDAAEQLLRELDPQFPDEASAMRVLSDAIRASGGISVEGAHSEARWDIGVWSDDLAAIGGNPLVIEIKRRLDTTAVDQLRRHMARQNSWLGLVVYLEEPTDAAMLRAIPGAWFPVLVISLRDLLNQLRSRSFAQVVQSLRNRAVHGWPRQ